MAAVLVGASCTGGQQPAMPSSRPTPSITVIPSSTPSVAVREQIVLNVFLSEPVTPWRRVAFLRFGEARGELGVVTDPNRTPIPYIPRSFDIDPDGSIWILDVVKKRVAHFDRSGRFIGAIEGFRFDRLSPHPRDLAVSSGHVHVLEEVGDRTANVVVASSDGMLVRRLIQDRGKTVTVSYLFRLAGGVGAAVGGYVEPAEGLGPSGHARLVLEGGGRVQVLPGIPVASNSWIQADFGDTDDVLGVLETVGGSATEQPIKLVVRPRPEASAIPAVWGGAVLVPIDQAIGIFARVSPVDPADAERYGGARWFMRVGRGALIFERLPDNEISDEELVRPIAAGPDGSPYLMLIRKKGVEILRRP
ncbi:MAG: hypothetical protein ACRDHO_05900 [Actinomycetota bacterium]